MRERSKFNTGHRDRGRGAGSGPVRRGRVRRLLAGAAALAVTGPLAAAATMAPAAAADVGGGQFGPWEWRSHSPQGNPLTGVHFSDADTGTAVGQMGTILRTTDGGNTWTQQPNPVTDAGDHHAFTDVQFFDADTGIAVSHGGNGSTVRDDLFVYRTFDGGATWTESQVPDTVDHLEAVSFADANNGYAVGNYHGDVPGDIAGTALVLRTTDGGATWQDQSPRSPANCPGGPFSCYQLYGVQAVDADTVIAAGTAGTIVRSDDGGDSWTVLANDEARPLPTPPFAQYNGVFFHDPDEGFVVGTSGRIWHTVDGGDTWAQRFSPQGSGSLRAVEFTDASTGWIAASGGTVLHTADGGLSWQALDVFTDTAPLPLNGLSFPTPEVGIAVGAAGAIVRTEDGGDSWAEQSSRITTTALTGVAFDPAGTGTGLAVGLQGMVQRTTDAGDTWTTLPFPGEEDLEDVVLLDAHTAIVVSGTDANTPGVALRTDDRGESWQRQDGLGNGRLREVTCADAATCMAVSALGGVVRTVDGGQSWVDVAPPADIFPTGRQTNLESVSCPEPDVCVVVGWDGAILRTTDGGRGWQLQDTGPSTSILRDVVFIDADTGWVAGDGGVFLHTSDGGGTWDEVPLVPAAGGFTNYESISFADENTGTVVGAKGYVWRTADGGQSWVEEQRRAIYWLNGVAHVDADTAVAVGGGTTPYSGPGVILKRVGDTDPDPDPVPSEGSQDIIATVPDTPGDGSLVLSVDPGDRTVTLPELADAGDRLATSGGLRPVTVTDTRATTDPGWDASAQVSGFTGDAGSFGGGYLGWTPSVASQSSGQTVAAGAAVDPGFPTGDGLSVPRTLATAGAGSGVGTAVLGAGLALEIPTDTPPGTYTAVLTLTAI